MTLPPVPSSAPATPATPVELRWVFARRLLMVALAIGLALLLYRLGSVLVLVFGATLVAVLLRGLANVLVRRLKVPQRLATLAAVVLCFGVVIGFFALFGLQLADQLRQVGSRLPGAVQALGERLDMDWSLDALRQAVDGSAAADWVRHATAYGLTTAGVLTDVLLVLVAGIFFASSPDVYRRGALWLLPRSQRPRVGAALDATAHALRRWFAGQLVQMVAVGLMSLLAYGLIGLPSAVALAVVAGLTNFIPIVGPIVGGALALVMAAAVDMPTVLWTLLAVGVIQQIESVVLMPRIQQHAVAMPPALTLFALAAFGSLFGPTGIILGMPMAVAAVVSVQMLWVRDVLGEDIQPLGGGD